jgi:hypothetical protein
MKKLTANEKISVLKKVKTFIKSKKFGKYEWCDGICHVLDDLILDDKITTEQHVYVRNMLPTKNDNNWPYCWPAGAKSPRIQFIDSKLNKLNKLKIEKN